MDKNTIQKIVDQIENLSIDGVNLECASARYSESSGYAKLIIEVASGDNSPMEAQFKRTCTRYGLKANDLGRDFYYENAHYKIIGLKPQNTKYPIICEEVKTGKHYKLALWQVLPYLDHV